MTYKIDHLKMPNGAILDVPLLVNLTTAMMNRNLLLGKNNLGDWLRSLSDSDLKYLVQQATDQLDSISEEKGAELVGCVMHLLTLETGYQSSYEIKIDDLLDYCLLLKPLAIAEQMRRLGAIEIKGSIFLTKNNTAKILILDPMLYATCLQFYNPEIA